MIIIVINVKISKIILLVFIIIFVTGCNKEKSMVCTMDINNKENNYILKATYKIYYKDNYVTKINKEEIYTSSDENVIKYFKEFKKLEYENMNDLYGGYEYNIKSNNDYINIYVTIDLKNVDIHGMVKNGEIEKDYTINNRLTSTGAKYLYISKGAVCGS